MPTAERGRALTALAIVLALLAVSDFLKPLRLEGADTGLVVLGRRLVGRDAGIAGAVAGTFLALYALGVWQRRRWALPMACLYGAHVILNVLLFPFRTPQPPDAGLGYWTFGVVYTVLAIGGSIACIVLLRRADLR